MNINDVYQLMDRFEGSTLGELSIEMEGVKFSAKKGYMCESVAPQTTAQAQINAPIHIETKVEEAETSQSVADDSKVITAPLVGTFYRAPGPGEAPFVEVGASVKAGDVVGIIEAMKLMNEITATSDGVVKAILVEDGELVEFGKPLIQMV